ncbi:Putative membrane protein YeiH [Streptomyces davaonensis JCM 4913]|uniref:Putative membrane protein YeiH n=1 Tax=Streptomyces davaonensis (strain DSM 101723 / JCM 4913 / KCC S-0913 / 768) TaxID=1214101 RepID=K4QSE3_STRDJ|nr:putative sulfate exporter family transporter [Streptomyces davaonensis]CCK24501.1 Putative membrane protein YeiH [Streptomyces davaonensis JCM 4913]
MTNASYPSRSRTTRPRPAAERHGVAITARLTGCAVRLPGLTLAVTIALVATAAGRLAPVVGGPVSAVVLGILVAVAVRPGQRLRPGITFAGRGVLQAAVVVLGAQLSLGQVLRVGVGSLPVMLGTLAACLTAAYWIGRRLDVVRDLRTLIGVGTGICGASAIAAVTPVVGAAEAQVAYAISTIFVFNIAAVLTFPAVGHLLGMSQDAFGLFAGTAINDMSSVVAAAATYGDPAADEAVVVKLARTLMIIPICLGLAALARRRARKAEAPAGATGTANDAHAAGPGRGDAGLLRVGRLVPWFLVGFLALAAVNTAGLIPSAAHAPLSTLAVFLITVALSAIGLSTQPAALRRTGPAPLILGGCLWLVVTATSLAFHFLDLAR